MKVVYNSILNDIDDRIAEAKNSSRTLKYIELTAWEWAEFRKELFILCRGHVAPIDKGETNYQGIALKQAPL